MGQTSKIAEWYSGKSIFVTGATGFMGKVLVEKLLRACPKIRTIYILIRAKKGKDPLQRLDDFLNCPVFDKIRDRPDGEALFNKLHCVSGDVTQPNCGLSDQDILLLQDTVNVVFHMAANVRFDQPLKSAVVLNTGGTLNVLELVCKIQNLKSFVHVSTSYCHCDETILEEKLYRAPHNPRHILDLVKWMDNDVLKTVTPRLLKNSPNTYAYTKCLTEQLVSEYGQKLPIAIARPSIVIAAWKEPIPGWVDNLNGPTGILVGAGKGIIRTMHCNAELTADIVPVDVSINSLIVIAWKTGLEVVKNEVDVYHITANKEHAMSWGEQLELGKKHFYNYPFSVCLWYPGGSIKSTYFVHSLAVFFFHMIPAYVVDLLMVLTNNKPFLVRTQKRIQNGLSVLQYYTTRPWFFHNEKLSNIYETLNSKDKEIFYTSDKFDNDSFMKNYILGARKYCVHEEPETIPYARKVLKSYFSQGTTMQAIAWTYHVGHSTVHYTIIDTANAIWEVLSGSYLKPPSSVEDWQIIAKQFQAQWNFPNCLGSMDGKHINIQAPAKSGSQYFNYKKTFSIVLLAACDANYNFTLVDIGAYGSESDGGIFANSLFGNMLEENKFNVPPPAKLPNTDILHPYALVADSAFPLNAYIMRPYPGRDMNEGKRIFNYRLSRARRTIENTFGILVNRWRLLRNMVVANVDNIDLFVKAIVCLHNYVKAEAQTSNDTSYCPPGFLDTEERRGTWRDDVVPLQSIGRVAANRAARIQYNTREVLKDYFLSPAGQVPWQRKVLTHGGNPLFN